MLRRFMLPLLLLCSCNSLPQESHNWNPAGWPAKAFNRAGFEAADSGWPLLRDLGRLLYAVGELIDAPALLLEGVFTADPKRLVAAGEHALVGTGSSTTALYNLPFFWIPGGTLDLASDVDLVNSALAHMEQQPPERWHTSDSDERTIVFPIGTRARASGQNLIYDIPGYERVLQVAEGNALWDGMQSLLGTNFPAQERSWGFIARSREDWESIPPRQRAITILHELYHQELQMHRQFMGWTTFYWPAYLAVFPFTGWQGHWAEMDGPNAAGAVDRALADWSSSP